MTYRDDMTFSELVAYIRWAWNPTLWERYYFGKV